MEDLVMFDIERDVTKNQVLKGAYMNKIKKCKDLDQLNREIIRLRREIGSIDEILDDEQEAIGQSVRLTDERYCFCQALSRLRDRADELKRKAYIKKYA